MSEPAAHVRGAWWALALLSLVYAVSFVDRTILSAFGEPIKRDFGLSDLQLGLLGGLGFALTYALFGVPLALLSERYPRKLIIAVALLVWSVTTFACGAATGFASLMLLRGGVGFGEAGFTPPAHALISDFFPPRRRPLALGLFNAAIPVGFIVAALAGGWLVHQVGWRVGFMVIGLPGIVLAPIVYLTMREPKRGESEGRHIAGSRVSALAVLRHLARRRSAIYLILTGCCAALPLYTLAAFAVSFLVRRHGLSILEATWLFGFVVAGGQFAGTIGGGAVAERLAARGVAPLLLVPAAASLLAGVLLALAWQSDSAALCVIFLGLGTMCASAYVGPVYAALHGMLTPNIRATGLSLVLLFHAVIGLGLGPPLFGWISDRMAGWHYGPGYAAACLARNSGHRLDIAADPCLHASALGLGSALTISAAFAFVSALLTFLAARRTDEHAVEDAEHFTITPAGDHR